MIYFSSTHLWVQHNCFLRHDLFWLLVVSLVMCQNMKSCAKSGMGLKGFETIKIRDKLRHTSSSFSHCGAYYFDFPGDKNKRSSGEFFPLGQRSRKQLKHGLITMAFFFFHEAWRDRMGKSKRRKLTKVHMNGLFFTQRTPTERLHCWKMMLKLFKTNLKTCT